MSDFSEAILSKIKESEEASIEKQRKIAEYEKEIKELKFLDNCEKEKITELKAKRAQANIDLMSKRIEKSKLQIRGEAVLGVIEQKRDEVRMIVVLLLFCTPTCTAVLHCTDIYTCTTVLTGYVHLYKCINWLCTPVLHCTDMYTFTVWTGYVHLYYCINH